MLDYQFFYILSVPFYIIFIIFLLSKKIKIEKIFLYSFFYFYIISLIAITIFPIPIQWLDEVWKYVWENNNFTPLSSIFDILLNKNLDIYTKIKQVIWNIIIFIPMWFFIPVIWKNKRIFKKALFIWFLLSISIELIQLIISTILWFNYRIVDIDDVLLNTIWFTIGYYLYKTFKNKKNS